MVVCSKWSAARHKEISGMGERWWFRRECQMGNLHTGLPIQNSTHPITHHAIPLKLCWQSWSLSSCLPAKFLCNWTNSITIFGLSIFLLLDTDASNLAVMWCPTVPSVSIGTRRPWLRYKSGWRRPCLLGHLLLQLPVLEWRSFFYSNKITEQILHYCTHWT